MVEVFPELAEVAVTHSWNGYVAFNWDELPRLFVRDGIHHAVGYCGSGTVWARWLGAKAAYDILGDPRAEAAFRCDPPRAIPFYGGRPWFVPGLLALESLRDRLDLGSSRLS